ncbi:MAG: transketolase [Nitrospirales bacterium]|nr:transketolase [Nitrospirales bacterium]
MTHSANQDHLQQLSTLMRHWILTSSHQAGSGHPTSSLSAVELMVDLFFEGHFRFDVDKPDFPNNDRLIFSKGHASPLLYTLWAAAGQITEQELMTYREFGSPLEGHATSRFRFAEAATGSLGQGLSIGVGMALNAKYLDRLPYRTFVLLGDSEMAEGSQWEALQLAAHYKLNNLVGILDVNRLGQRGETMYGHDLTAYQQRIDAFGWQTIVVENGHDHGQVLKAYEATATATARPVMIIAKTIKGKGISFLADKDGWHGKALDDEKMQQALKELGEVDHSVRGKIAKPTDEKPQEPKARQAEPFNYTLGEKVPTRMAYGKALTRLAPQFPELIAMDGEVSNSTKAELFRDEYPDRFFEMFIAEQNMVGAALGLSLRGKLPFVSTFAAFMARAFDQIRMGRYSDPNIKFVGSHAGVSIGEDGPSQMGLEDIAMFRTILDGVVLYPCDAVSTERLVEAMARHQGIAYLRTTRGSTPVIYENQEQFTIGGCKILRQSEEDQVTVIGAGITVHEALKAHDLLLEEGWRIRVVDLYSIKPMDIPAVRAAAEATGLVITVEDHYAEGGLGEAVRSALAESPAKVHCLAVRKRPKSGKPEELLDDEEISATAIIEKVRSHLAALVSGRS